jgi:drug/metabolite transporter (DMT)-like permease
LHADTGTRIDLAAMPPEGVARCRAAWARLAGRPTCVVHGNPGNPGNIRMNAERVALIDWDESHVDAPDLDLALPHNAADLEGEAQDIASQASAAWEAAVCWGDEHAVRKLAFYVSQSRYEPMRFRASNRFMDSSKAFRLGLLLVTLSALVWSTAGLFTRIISVDTPTMLLWRGIFGSLGFFAYMLFQEGFGAFGRLRRMDRWGYLYAFIGMAAMQMYIASFRLTSVAHVAVIYAVIPFVASGLGWLAMREQPSRTALASSFVALIGVAVMVGFGAGEGHISGDLLALGMTIAMAGLMVLARRHAQIDLLAAACVSTFMSAMVSLPFSSAQIPAASELAILAAFGILSMAAGFILFAYGSRLLPPTETALIGALDAPLSPVWVWLFFAETPQRATLIGGAIVFAAVTAHFALQARSNGRMAHEPVSP